jgi:hypothetical protein
VKKRTSAREVPRPCFAEHSWKSLFPYESGSTFLSIIDNINTNPVGAQQKTCRETTYWNEPVTVLLLSIVTVQEGDDPPQSPDQPAKPALEFGTAINLTCAPLQ